MLLPLPVFDSIKQSARDHKPLEYAASGATVVVLCDPRAPTFAVL